jgi:hypothetical protein
LNLFIILAKGKSLLIIRAAYRMISAVLKPRAAPIGNFELAITMPIKRMIAITR